MRRFTGGDQPSFSQERHAAELVERLSGGVPVLVREGPRSARLETRQDKQAGIGARMLGGGGLIALYGMGCLITCVAIATVGAVTAWLAVLMVGVALLAMAGIAALLGKSRPRQATPRVPAEAVTSVKADMDQIREGVRW